MILCSDRHTSGYLQRDEVLVLGGGFRGRRRRARSDRQCSRCARVVALVGLLVELDELLVLLVTAERRELLVRHFGRVLAAVLVPELD